MWQTQQLEYRVRKSVVAITNSAGEIKGTGFFITPEGLIITCWHVVERIDEGIFVDREDSLLEARLLSEMTIKEEDIDIAILVDKGQLASFSVPAFISLLEKTLRYRVDLVVLNRAGEVLKYEVRRTGKLIFERSPEIRKRFEVSSRKYYEDFLFLHTRYASNVLYGGTYGK